MWAPVSSSLNSTAIDSLRTVSASAISSSVSARFSSFERPSISSCSAMRRPSPKNQPRNAAAHVIAATQATVSAGDRASAAPEPEAATSASQGVQRTSETRLIGLPRAGRSEPLGGLGIERVERTGAAAACGRGAPLAPPAAGRPGAAGWPAALGRPGTTPRRAGRRRPTCVTPLKVNRSLTLRARVRPGVWTA